MDFGGLFSFEGRVDRTRFVLTEISVFTATYFFAFVFIVASGAGDERLRGITPTAAALVSCSIVLFVFAMGWIALATAVKRCHDRNLSGWMLLFSMPPLLGQLWLMLNLFFGESLEPKPIIKPEALAAMAEEPQVQRPRYEDDLSQLAALA